MDTSTPVSPPEQTPAFRRPFTVLVVDHRPEGASDEEATAMSAEACDAFTRIHDLNREDGVTVSIAAMGSDGEPLGFDRLFRHWEMLGHYAVSKADLSRPEDLRRVRFLSAILAQFRSQGPVNPAPQP